MKGRIVQTDRIGWARFAVTEWKTYRQWWGGGVGLGEYEYDLEEHQPTKHQDVVDNEWVWILAIAWSPSPTRMTKT